MTTPVLRTAEIPASDLTQGLLAPPSAEPLSGDIAVGSQLLWVGLEDRITAGTWECAPGRSRWEFDTRGEFIHVTAGSMTVTRDGEDGVLLTAGSTALFELGWHGTWEVHETLRKVFVVFKP